jgi:hypothetical protein
MKITNFSPDDMVIVQSAATCALRFAYHNTVDAPLPATFIALLKQLAVRQGEDLFSTGSREGRSGFKLSQ